MTGSSMWDEITRMYGLLPGCDVCGTRGVPPARKTGCDARIHVAAIRCTKETGDMLVRVLTMMTPEPPFAPIRPLAGIPIVPDDDVPSGEVRFVDTDGEAVDSIRLWPVGHQLVRGPFGDWTIDEKLLAEINSGVFGDPVIGSDHE